MTGKTFPFLTLLLALLLVAVGCDDSPTTATPPPPPPPPPPQLAPAMIELEIIGFGALASGQGNLFGLELRMEETAGTGTNINFVRIEVFRATGEFEERQEIGATRIIEQTGSNRLEANSSRQDIWLFFFNATVKRGRTIRVTVGFTDDTGVSVDRTLDFVFT